MKYHEVTRQHDSFLVEILLKHFERQYEEECFELYIRIYIYIYLRTSYVY